MSHVEIAKRLEEKGLNINAKRLTDLFRNPFYCGLMVNSLIPGEVIQGKHEALISKEIFLGYIIYSTPGIRRRNIRSMMKICP